MGRKLGWSNAYRGQISDEDLVRCRELTAQERLCSLGQVTGRAGSQAWPRRVGCGMPGSPGHSCEKLMKGRLKAANGDQVNLTEDFRLLVAQVALRDAERTRGPQWSSCRIFQKIQEEDVREAKKKGKGRGRGKGG